MKNSPEQIKLKSILPIKINFQEELENLLKRLKEEKEYKVIHVKDHKPQDLFNSKNDH